MSTTVHTKSTPAQLAVDQRANITLTGGASAGGAIAVNFFKVVKEQANTLGRYLKLIHELNTEGRVEFRKVLEAKRREMRASVKDVAESPMAEPAKRAGASAFVRISEAIVFSKAVDAGYGIEDDGDELAFWTKGYHWHIANARVLLESEASTGPTVKRGRPATSKVQKAVSYLDKLALSDDEKAALVAALTA